MSTWETHMAGADAHAAGTEVRRLIAEGRRNGRIADHLAAYILAELDRELDRGSMITRRPERGVAAPAVRVSHGRHEGGPGMDSDAIRVLLVDDHNGFRRALRHLLEADGLDVVGEVSDGCAGVVASRHLAPDLILAGFHMPLMDGLAMARLIKAGPRPPAIVLFSGERRLVDGPLLRSAGIDRLLEKGCSTETIVAAVRHLVAQRRALVIRPPDHPHML